MRELQDKVAVVTGAASGIGRATALQFAREGMDLSLADVDEAGMERAAEEIRSLGRRCIAVPTDVSSKADVEGLLARTLEQLGRCDLVFNNAGIMHAGALLDASDEDWQRIIDIDLWGVIHGCRVFGAHFVAQGHGHIVNTASTAGLFGVPGLGIYSVAKFGVVGLSRTLRFELASKGVGVTVLCPGMVRTNLPASGGFDAANTLEFMKAAASAEGLALRVVKAVRRDRGQVLYGREAYILTAMLRLPSGILDRLGRMFADRALPEINNRFDRQ